MNKFTFSVLAGVGLTVVSHAEMPQYRATQFTIPRDTTVTDTNSRGDVLYTKRVAGLRRAFIHRLDGTTTMLPEFFSPEGRAAHPVQLDDFGNLALVVDTVVPGGSQVGIWNERDGVRMMPIPPFSVSFTMTPTDFTNGGLVSWNTVDLPGSNNARGLWNIHTNELTTFQDAASREVRLTDVSEGGFAVGPAFFTPFASVFHPDGSGYRLQSPEHFGRTLNLSSARLTVSNEGIVVGTGVFEPPSGLVSGTYVWDKWGNILQESVNTGFGFSGISGSGLIIGNYFNEPNRFRPFLTELGSDRISLDSLISERNFDGELFGSPLQIFDNNAILHQVHPGNSSGAPKVFVFLEPVPEPGTMLVLGAGLAALLRRRRRTNSQNIRDGNVRPDTGGL